MSEIKRVKIDSILESQIPEFLTEDSPLFVEFLRQYYKSLEHQSGSIDLSTNIKKYKDISKFNEVDLKTDTLLSNDVLSYDNTIFVENTIGWPDSYGLLKIDNEIITYTSKTQTSFVGCIRGFSGIDKIESFENSEFLNFSVTNAEEHSSGSIVTNLSNLFLLKFFENFKYEFFLGFENRDFNENVSIENILINARNFYISKGTDSSYKFLFKVLYGTDLDIIKPNDYTLKPSSDTFFTTKNILVEKISGPNPVDTKGNFLFQNVGISTVSGSIFNVEFRPIKDKNLYEISLDSSSISGTFEVTGQTKILEDVEIGADNILVDSTIGFSQSGKLLVKPENSDFIEITYLDKTTNQFLGVSGIIRKLNSGLSLIEDKFAFSYVGFGNTSKVEFRVINVIENIDFSKTSNLRLGDKIKLSSFGKDLSNDVKFSSWIYNIPTTHKVQKVEQETSNKFRLTLFDKVSVFKNEIISIVDKGYDSVQAEVISIDYDAGDQKRKYSNKILVQLLENGIETDSIISIQKKVYKGNHYSNYFPNITKYPSSVQNTYVSKDGKYFYVTSTGIPNYTIYVTDDKRTLQTFNEQNRPANLQGFTSSFFCPNHSYVNGNLVFYNTNNLNISGVSTGYYYVTVVDDNNIKLSFSKSDIFSKKYIEAKSGITSDTIVIGGYENKSIENQKILKKFPISPDPSVADDFNKRTSNNRAVGLLVNGTELLAPTYFDENIFYGALESIKVTNPGTKYDVVDPPPIEIIDSLGNGAKAHVNLSGKVDSIKIISPGIGYQSKPKINIFGGNGRGCALESNLVKSRLTFGFKSEINVDSPSNSISFLTNIAFSDGEEVIYDSNTNLDVPGLINGSTYFVGIVSETRIKLYTNKENALNKVNEVDIVGVSSGFHYFTTLKSKNTITEIYVKDPGEGYSNRKIKVPSILSFDNKTIGINTFDSYIFAPNHGFSDAELVQYSTTDTPISGLSTTNYYYTKIIDNNKFKLSFAGSGTTDLSVENYTNKKYIKFESLGIGTHIIGYPSITITVEATSALGSTSIISPILKPVILGSIDDVYLEYGGTGYGCTNIINFHRRPDVGISSVKSQASLKAIVVNGKIVDVKITNPGRGYRIDSDIIINGEGDFAKIDPVIDSDGRLIQVNIVDGGIGYESATTVLELKNRGVSAKFLANVKQWKVDQVVKLSNIINPNDDGILLNSRNESLGLQFCSYYIPKKLRYQLSDNYTISNKESSGSLQHSPILGYAYDGNPIYGPYGYDTPYGGPVRQIQTSYVLNSIDDSSIRPPEFKPGYFIDDYIYDGSGDLDEHNGRFCVTPEYPDGVYAYFYSVDIDAAKIAKNKYPYVVGPSFNNLPVTENFLPRYNQDLDIFTNDITRNVGPYYLNYNYSSYGLIDSISEDYKQEFEITKLSSGKIENVSIFSEGDNYKIGDIVNLDNTETGGTGSNIVISSLKGKTVDQTSIQTKTFSNVSVIPKSNIIEFLFNEPHEFNNLEPVVISGISTITAAKIEGLHNIEVIDKAVRLEEDIPTLGITGISTFIKVTDISGFSANDFIGVGTEKLLITRVSTKRSGFYVNRISNTGFHTCGIDDVILLPKKFSIKVQDPISDVITANTVTFFDPKESVGTGSSGIIRTVVGLGTTSFESRFLPAKSIYLPDHKFYTGEPLTYNTGVGGTSLYVNLVGSAVSFALNNNQTVYAVNLGKDYLGISTVGYTTFTGIGTELSCLEFWNLNEAFGVVGSAHSFTTQNSKILSTVTRTSGIITTTTNHGLSVGDEVKFTVNSKLTETFKVFFDNINRKVLINEFSIQNSDVSLDGNYVQNNNFIEIKNGTKIVYFAQDPLGGLSNGKSYFILKKDNNKISFCEYEKDIDESKEINITSLSGGGTQYIKLINPQITPYKGSIIRFDLSDNSLIDMTMDFYFDGSFTRKIELIGLFDEGFAITRSGIPGQNNSYVELNTNKTGFPTVLYYKLNPISPLDQSKYQLSIDKEVTSANKINIIKHQLNTKIKIDLINDDKTFSFSSPKNLTTSELLIFNSADIDYTTDSKTADGPINDIKINFGGRGYTKIPVISSIKSQSGKNAVLKLISGDIGKIEMLERIKDGFDYPTDPTLSAQLSSTLVCGIKNIRTIDRIDVLNGGKNYNNSPVLFIKNNPGIELKANTDGKSVSSVTIVKNSTSLKNPLEIIPIYNSNGYEIDSLTIAGNDITLELLNSPSLYPLINSGYGSSQTEFPFAIGDEIFIEKCSLTNTTNSLANFNSSSYDYKFFTVTGVNTSNNTVTYSMAGISTGSFGTYNEDRRGVVINKKDMASFDMILKDDVKYQSSEKVISPTFIGKVMEGGWDNKLNQMRLTTLKGTLQVGDSIFGEESKVNGVVEYINAFDFKSTLGPTRDKSISSNTEGLLNEMQQRISDNFYYQKFSYSLRSNVPYSTWREAVRSIVHPSGFQEFSDYILYTKPTSEEVSVGIAKSQNMKPALLGGESLLFVNIDSEVDFYTRKNYALVYEDDLFPDGSTDKIFFTEGVQLKPYTLNETNKVVLIDDIGEQFTGFTSTTGEVVGLSTFVLKNKGNTLFKHTFNSSSSNIIDLTQNVINITNHNYQTGQELSYDYLNGNPIGIATTSYVGSGSTILMQVYNLEGTAVLENGYSVSISTSITGVSTVLLPTGPISKSYLQCVGLTTTGTGAEFTVFITYSNTTGQPLSTSIVPTKGGSGYYFGQTVSIAGTYIGGISPTNDLSFVISNVGPTGIATRANEVYINVPSNDSNGAIFNVTRNSSGYVSTVNVVNGGVGYSSTSTVSIAGTYLGGSTDDYVSFSPLVLGSNKLPETVFVYKFNDNQFALLGLSTSSTFLNLNEFGTGTHSLTLKNPNSSTLISIDGIVQPALTRTSIVVSLGASVSTSSTTIVDISSGISSIFVGDILKLNNEYLLIKNIIRNNNKLIVERGSFGTSSGVHTIGVSAPIFKGKFNIVGDTIFFSTPPYGLTGPTGIQTRSSFSGRVFSRKFDPLEPEDVNVIFDDISNSFTGIAATQFTIKVDGNTTTTIYNNINYSTDINNIPLIFLNGVFQSPITDFTVENPVTNSLVFLSGTPSAGKISAVSISTSYGYQPRLVASADAVVSTSGTISSIVINGAGSGYRNTPPVSLASTIGYGASLVALVGTSGTTLGIITSIQVINPGVGYTITSPPTVFIGIPTGYSNLGVAYTGGTSGVGQNAKVTVEVGAGSSIITFKIDNPGIGYKVGDQLKVVGIPTDPNLTVQEFILTVDNIETDSFSGFYPGQFIVFNDISSAFNGFRKKFTLTAQIDGQNQVVNLKTPIGSDLDITNNIFIFLNDILQVPNYSYTFKGSRVIFTEPPISGSKCTILYYRGSIRDVNEIVPPKTIKEGDSVTIQESATDLYDIEQFDRVTKTLVSSDQLETFVYTSIGINSDTAKFRPLTWKKQKSDRIILGSLFSKSRPNLKSNVSPNATIIKSISPTDEVIYLDNAFPLFSDVDGLNENLRNLVITENKEVSSALGYAVVSGASTISSILITDPGVGYANTSLPKVTISASAIKIKDPIYNWTFVEAVGITTTSVFNELSYGNQFVSIGNSSLYAYSFDAENWIVGNVGVGTTVNFNSIKKVGVGSSDIILAVGSNGKIVQSIGYATTITSWTEILSFEEVSIPGVGIVGYNPTSFNGEFNSIVYGNNKWVTVGAGGSIFVASGVTTSKFVSRYSGVLQNLNSVDYGKGYFVAVGNNGTVISSDNGINWDVNFNGIPITNWNKVLYDGNNFIIVGDNATIIRSVNRNLYESITNDIDISEDIINIKYYNNLYVATTSSNKLYYSFNLSNWTPRSTSQPNQINDFIFANNFGLEGIFVAVGYGGTIITSTPEYHRATAEAVVVNDEVTSVNIIDGGFGYFDYDAPSILIEPDTFKKEVVKSFKVKGDYGTIIGVTTFLPGTPGIGTTTPKVSFTLKSETYDNTTLGIGYSSLNTFGITACQLEKGDYFIISDSNVVTDGSLIGITTLFGGMSNYPNSKVGTAVSFLDGVYIVEDVTPAFSGIVTVTCNFAPDSGSSIFVASRGIYDSSGSTFAGINTNNFYGRYSWSKIYDFQNRSLSLTGAKSFNAYTDNGLVGLSTSAKVIRTRPVLSN